MNINPINGNFPVNGAGPALTEVSLPVPLDSAQYGIGQVFLVAGIPTKIHLPLQPPRLMCAPTSPAVMGVVCTDRIMRAPGCGRTMYAKQLECD
jgi:hypothetical protein